jgi:putative membrane-bound dehydrogenase-like protein
MIHALIFAAAFPALYNSEPEPGLPMSATEAAQSMQMPAGFRCDLFASEPMVQNPIAMAWDRRGRLWIAENYTYAERAKRFDLALRDRVIVLEDADHDGRAEKRTVFIETVQMLTSVEVGRGGVWLMCPPQLLFVPDANEDLVPDGAPQVMLDGFTVAQDNYHNFANGLRWGPDGWLYGRCGHSCPGELGVPGAAKDKRVPIKGGIWRYNVRSHVVEVLTHGTTNPWGLDWDEHGEAFFVNSVNGHLWHLIPGAHFKESFGVDPNPQVYERLDTIADHYHYDTGVGWQKSIAGQATDLGGGHAHIGAMFYQGDQWPSAMRGELYTLNLHGRRTNVEHLERRGSSYVGRHRPDQFQSADLWFRGIDLSTGPDGSVFVIDWSDTGECHESTGVHRESGRIFRITHGEPVKPTFDDLQKLDADSIKRVQAMPNVWWHRQLIANADRITVELPEPKTLRDVWLAMASGKLSWIDIAVMLKRDDEHHRAWAVRAMVDAMPIDHAHGRHPQSVTKVEERIKGDLLTQAMADESALVRLAMASSLQRLPLEERSTIAAALMTHIADGDDQQIPSIVWYGITALSAKELATLGSLCRWPSTLRWIARTLASRMEAEPLPIATLMYKRADAAVLQGMSEGLTGWRKATKPTTWDDFAKKLKGVDDARLNDLATLFGDGRALDEVKRVALDAQAELPMRQAALRTLIQSDTPELRAICESLLETRVLNTLAVEGLAKFDDPAIGSALAKNYRKFATAERPAVMSVLASRASFASAMLSMMAKGSIPRADLSAYHARQIIALNDAALSAQLKHVWGDLGSVNADKAKLISEFKAQLTGATLAKADLKAGRVLFTALCSTCHVMYGVGARIGPDLTGSNRTNLDYLLENILDPSGVVSADYRMSTLKLKDGRVLTGIISARTDRTISLRSLTGEQTLEKTEVTSDDAAPISLMPEGLLLGLSEAQRRDLIAYLMHPVQVVE